MFSSKLLATRPRLLSSLSKRLFSFEQNYKLFPRYFLVSLQYKDIEDAKDELQEHYAQVSTLMQDRKVVMKGEYKDETGMFLIYSNALDERDPHQFIMTNPLYIGGFIKQWKIEELDLLEADRDDEITLYQKYR